ncbi:hypothetical protein MPSEU_000872700 [Mayamaea pseudoterrestris]|nr:hypothetical protein MPSEU_000872700 [Mayamaea pseudoterrestris]
MRILLPIICLAAYAKLSNGLALENPRRFSTASKETQQSTFSINQPTSSKLSRRQVMNHAAAAATTAAFAATQSGLLLPAHAAVAASTTSSSSSLHLAAAATTATTTKIPTVSLGKSKLQLSRSIQGYWQLAGGHGKYRESDALANMKAHYDAGFTSLDTADIYGPSERIVGNFVGMQQQPEKPVVCTKLCCFRFLDDINRVEVRDRITKACERLQVKQLPLVALFWSNYDVKRYVDVGLYLAELQEEGLIGEIGATNFDLVRLQELHKAGVPLVSHQVQLSALDRRPVQSGMVDWCKEHDIKIISFGSVASGILSDASLNAPLPLTKQEQTTASLRLYSNTAERFGDWSLVQELLHVMNDIAQGVRIDGRCEQASISNVAQRYVLDTPGVAAIIIGVRNLNHLEENVRTHSFTLKADELEAINQVVAKRKGPKGDVWDIERGYVV